MRHKSPRGVRFRVPPARRCLFGSKPPAPLALPPDLATVAARAASAPAPDPQASSSSSAAAPKPAQETHPSGLVIVRAARAASTPTPSAPPAPTQGHAVAPSPNDDPAMTQAELGLDHVLPWTQDFNIRPQLYNKDWRPKPPATYRAAMHRQRRLLHGATRRAYLHLHRPLAEAVLGIIAAAQQHEAIPPPGHLALLQPVAAPPPPSFPPQARSVGASAHAAPQELAVNGYHHHGQAPQAPAPAPAALLASQGAPPPLPAGPPPAAALQPIDASAYQLGSAGSGSSSLLPPLRANSNGMALLQRPAAAVGAPQPLGEAVELSTSVPSPQAQGSQQQQQEHDGEGHASWTTSVGRRSHRRVHPTGVPVAESYGAGATQPYNQHQHHQQQHPPPSAFALAAAYPNGNGNGWPGLLHPQAAAAVPQQVTCFADALLRCADPAGRDAAVAALGQTPGYARFVSPTPGGGGQGHGGAGSVSAHTQRLEAEVDGGELSGLATAPVASLVLVLEHLMGRLTASAPALSEAAIKCARDHYQTLPYDESGDNHHTETTLGPLPASDQELLLLFSALLRHAAMASGGPGCEEHAKGLVGGVLRLLLGAQLERARPEAQEALTCLFWYLVRNDAAFAWLAAAKARRAVGGGRGKAKGGTGEGALLGPLGAFEGATNASTLTSSQTPSVSSPAGKGQTGHDPSAGLMLPPAQPSNGSAAAHAPQHAYAQQPGSGRLAAGSQAAAPAYQQLAPSGDAGLPVAPLPHTVGQGPPAFPAPPAYAPPLDTLVPAPAGLLPLLGPPQGPAGQPIISRGPDGQPDPRLYGAPAGAPPPLPSAAGLPPPLPVQLNGIPSAYIPDTTPGTQEQPVHDVWI